MKNLTNPGRISVVIVMLFLATLWLFPIWRIDLRAPQYPGGLSMQIWLNDIKGDVSIINGLNHYIGMQEIRKTDFREFIFLPVTILLFIVAGILVLLLKKKIYYYIWSAVFIVIASFSFYDFYMWEYNYGHHLNPHAPIRVPGMSYQPPLFGYKKLLNFEVLSQPDIAGWFYIGTGILLVSMTIYEWKKKEKMKRVPLILCMFGLMALSACQQAFEPLDYGHDACTHCKMTIIDKHFAVELVTEKGKAYKFDDMACLLKYMTEQPFNSARAMIFVSNYNEPDSSFIDARHAIYLHREVFKTPMNGNYAAFVSDREAAPFKNHLQNDQLKWEDLQPKSINQ